MDALIRFMNNPLGRLLRVGLGVAIVAYGLMGLGGSTGWIVAEIGLIPIALGASGRCAVEFLQPRR